MGTWDVCLSLTTLDTSCTTPYTFFQLKPNDQFQGTEVTCMDKMEPILGTWEYKNGSIYISDYQTTCVNMPRSGYYNIKFLNDDLFYCITFSRSGENDGKPIFYIVKRRK